MEAGSEMTEPVLKATTRPGRRRRLPLLGLVAGVLFVLALAVLWIRVADPFNPYRPGTTHTATIVNSSPLKCPNAWEVDLGSESHRYMWRGVAPQEWDPQGVTGTLHILHNWSGSGSDAVFEADGQQVNLLGGPDDGNHFFNTNCGIEAS